MATAIKTEQHINLGGYVARGPFVRVENLPATATNYFSLDLLADGTIRVVGMGFTTNLRNTASDDKNRIDTLLKCKGVLLYAYLGPSVDFGPDVMQNIESRLRENQ
jgi:hypothetical protein